MGTKRAVVAALGVVLVAGWPLGVGVLPVGPAVAMAQEVQGADQDEDDEQLKQMMVLSIDRGSARYYAQLMELGEMERELAMEMYREYYERYRDVAVTTRDVMERAREDAGGDFEKMEALMRDAMRVVMAFLERSITLGEQYVGDLGQLAVTEAQQAGHERVVRTRQRELAVSLVGVDGGPGAIDLVRIGRNMEPPVLAGEGEGPAGEAYGPAGEALLAYERELERVCGPFVTETIDRYRTMVQSFMEGDSDGEVENQMQDAMVEMAATLNAAADRHAGMVRRALPEERQGEWDLAVNRARWPRVYAPGGVHRTHDAAMALDDLSADQRENIADAMAHYTREANPINKRWIAAMGQAQAARNAMRREWSEDLWADLQAKDRAAKDAQADREALDNRFAERILKNLTEAQRRAMPAQESDGIDADAVLRELGGG